jgi:hypothetical protein
VARGLLLATILMAAAPHIGTMETLATTLPLSRPSDPEGVRWALEVASAHWEGGAAAEAVKWIRRAGEIASDGNLDERALELFKAAAELAHDSRKRTIAGTGEPMSRVQSGVRTRTALGSELDLEPFEDIIVDEGSFIDDGALMGALPADAYDEGDLVDEESQLHEAIPLVRPASQRSPQTEVQDAPLPDWVPEDRVVGGYYVHRPLGRGAVGSVFVARRLDDLNVFGAPLFALKMPDYEAIKQQGLPQEMAEELFREEASALLSLPRHDNIARLVSYDGAARTPFLVMELVRGTSCETLLAQRRMSLKKALEIVDGVLDGLCAMHRAGVGHLDIKPSNVVLRDDTTPVLVDFGLAGRKIRPFFATGEYGAPEVWQERTPDAATPWAADVYSFGCMAFELLTGAELFSAPTVHALIAQHEEHDGRPRGVEALATRGHGAIAAVLAGCLRRDPRHRFEAEELRPMLKAVGDNLLKGRWPL